MVYDVGIAPIVNIRHGMLHVDWVKLDAKDRVQSKKGILLLDGKSSMDGLLSTAISNSFNSD